MSFIPEKLDQLEALASMSSNEDIRRLGNAENVREEMLNVWKLLNPKSKAPPLPLPAPGSLTETQYINKVKKLVASSHNGKMKEVLSTVLEAKENPKLQAKLKNMVGNNVKALLGDVNSGFGHKHTGRQRSIWKHAHDTYMESKHVTGNKAAAAALVPAKLTPGMRLALGIGNNDSLATASNADLHAFLQICMHDKPIPKKRKELLQTALKFNKPSPEVLTDRALSIIHSDPRMEEVIYSAVLVHNRHLKQKTAALKKPVQELFAHSIQTLKSSDFSPQHRKALETCVQKLENIEKNMDKSLHSMMTQIQSQEDSDKKKRKKQKIAMVLAVGAASIAGDQIAQSLGKRYIKRHKQF